MPPSIDYRDLPGFPQPSVEGHAGRLSLGKIGETPVAVLQGRSHYYEHGRADAMKVPVRTLHAIGCEALILTNAGGSLDPAMGPGSVMMITDHINLVQSSPLYDETGNSRFVDMVGAYDGELATARARCRAIGRRDAARRRLCLVLRPAFRDPGGGPVRAPDRRHGGRHVDGAGSDPGAPGRA